MQGSGDAEPAPHHEPGTNNLDAARGDLARDTSFYCSEMILRAAIELHNDINAAIDDKGGTHDAV